MIADAELTRAAELLSGARHGLAFTGAGVSTESGIPDFRGPNGLWKRVDPRTSSIGFFMEDPAAYWTISRERYPLYHQARPNAAHHALAALEEAGRLAGLVTQNTDGLHLDAGSRRVVEIHGSGRSVRCLDCGSVEAREAVQSRLGVEMPPLCRLCRGRFLKPEVVLFGESLPPKAIADAYALASEADLVLVAGSSLAVYPAADVPLEAVRAGAPLLIVNGEPTPFDDLAEVVLRGQAGDVLSRLVELAARSSDG